MEHVDLFNGLDPYPVHPGFKARETSAAAASEVAPKAPRLREMCLAALREAGTLTADECADRLGVDRLSIRPRFSELAATRDIIDSGQRRPNASHKRAIVWVVATPRSVE